ncbi:MAG TPA: hypothetical protein G4O05_03920, partial [Caldilineae bacterium]|nr:hypothetical protein [Caldilineae bacterium]
FFPARWLARYLPGVGLLQTTFLANALITIATALLLAAIVRRLGYSQPTSVALALIFGLATLAWPYATHLFGEPLSALSLTIALWALIALQTESTRRWSAVLGIALGVAVATSAAYALLTPFFMLSWFVTIARSPTSKPRSLTATARHLLALAIPLILVAAFLLWYNWMRFGSILDTGYHFDSGEGFNGPLLAGLYGLLLSPYRGILYHQPLTLLALIGFIPFWRRHRPIALLTAAVAVTLILIFSKWWIWWGGFAWGPRFLVPLAPYVTLWTAPLLRRWWAWLVIALSAGVQILAVSANYVLWEIQLRTLYPTDWNDPLRFGAPATDNPLHSPVFGQLYLLARGQWNAILDFAWWQPEHVFWWIPVAGLGLIVTAAMGLALNYRREKTPVSSTPLRHRASRVGYGVLPLILIPFTLFALQAYAQDSHYGQAGRGYQTILTELESSQGSKDTLVTVAPYHYQIPMNFYDGPLPILGFAAQQPLRSETENLLKWATARDGTIFLVTAGLPPAAPNNGVELWLNERAYRADDRWFDDFRLLHYGTSLPIHTLSITATWNDPLRLSLTDVRISTLQIRPGQVLNLELVWRHTGKLPPLHLFAQLLPATPPPVAQYDSAFPTNDWPAHEAQTTRVGLWIPPDTPPGDYTLIIGWYEPTTDRRFPVHEQDFLPLTTIHLIAN